MTVTHDGRCFCGQRFDMHVPRYCTDDTMTTSDSAFLGARMTVGQSPMDDSILRGVRMMIDSIKKLPRGEVFALSGYSQYGLPGVWS